MKIDRLISIIMVLLDKERIGAQELADMFEVSLRTIYRDIDAINLAGIPVRSISGVGGGFEIMPNYKIDKNVFSASELSAILMSLSGISNVIRDNEMINALTKVKSFIPSKQAKDIELKANQIYVDLNPWMSNNIISPYLDTIKTALQENKLLSFDYVDNHSNKTTRLVEPYQLVLKSSHWYFQGYCHDKKDYRLFRLSRMSNLNMETATFTPRNYTKPLLDYTDILTTLQRIKLRIHKTLEERILDYCRYEDLLTDGNDYYTVNFPFKENDYYYNILLSFGDKCECLEPLHIRKEIQRRAYNIAALYET